PLQFRTPTRSRNTNSFVSYISQFCARSGQKHQSPALDISSFRTPQSKQLGDSSSRKRLLFSDDAVDSILEASKQSWRRQGSTRAPTSSDQHSPNFPLEIELFSPIVGAGRTKVDIEPASELAGDPEDKMSTDPVTGLTPQSNHRCQALSGYLISSTPC